MTLSSESFVPDINFWPKDTGFQKKPEQLHFLHLPIKYLL